MKLHLDTIIIFVQNMELLKHFYVDLLQLDIVESFNEEWLLLNAGACKIGLHKIGDQYLDNTADSFKVETNTKIVFEIEEDIHRVRAGLLENNVLINEVKTFDNYNYWLCDGQDPEGNVFQLKQRK